MIPGTQVLLRPATLVDRRVVWEWACRSDLTASMMGPPTFPDHPPATWDEFCDDYVAHFWDDSAPELGRSYIIQAHGEAVGHVNYNDIFMAAHPATGLTGRTTELDIWLRAAAYTGRGYGPDAINALCAHLHRELDITHFMMQPSARNPRGVHVYRKCGFIPQTGTLEELTAVWGPADYVDSIYMIRTAPIRTA
jgi:RimJ/RimL family protein N-acetyltransferase